MESYLQGQDLQEILCGNDVKPSTEGATLKKQNIEVEKAMFTIKSTLEEEMLQYIKNVEMPKKALDTFATIFSKKNNTRVLLLKNDLLSISQQNMIVDEDINKLNY